MTVDNSNLEKSDNGSVSLTQDDCETLRALLPAYSVGATDSEETLLVEKLLPLCPEVAAELDTYLHINDALLYTAPIVEPPSHLRAALMAATQSTAVSAPEPKVAPVAAASKTAYTPSFWETVQQLLSGRPVRLATALAAISLLLLVGSNLYWLGQVSSLREREREILSLVDEQSQMLASFGQRGTNRVELASTEAGVTSSQAVVYWRPDSDVNLFTTNGLPSLTAGRTYELWLIRGEVAVGVGLFQVNSDGSGALVFNSDTPVGEFDAIGVTEEPEGGSEAPTSDPILVGTV